MTTIAIYLNNIEHSIPSGLTLQQVMDQLIAPHDGPIASALNGAHVPRARRAQTLVGPGDRITTFEPITGG